MIVEVIRGLNMGGAETLLFTRLRYVKVNNPEQFKRTIVVNTLGTSSYYAEALQGLGVPVITLASANPLAGAIELRRLLRSTNNVSTIVFHSPVTAYLEKLLRFVRTRPIPVRMIDVVHSTRYRPIYRILGALLDGRADVALAVSDDVASASTTAHYRRVVTLFAGVDVDRMRTWVGENESAPSDLRRLEGVPSQCRLMVAVGSLIPLKGHRYLIESLADSRLEGVALVLVGDGPERSSLESLAKALGVGDRVRFAGRVPDGWRWTAVADLIAHPSEYEGLPVALMEAAVLGTPIVATNVGGISQVLQKGADGVLIERQDSEALAGAISDVLARTPEISSIFANRARSDSFWSMQRYVDEFYSLVEPVAEERASP